ncbi:MAG: Gfo/Idh/MocA family oxidoreductase [Alphaproteobacteria bacterium]
MTPGVAVVGVGPWGANHARVFGSLGALAAVTDIDRARAEAIAGRHAVPALAFEAVLGDPTIGAVVIAAPAATHEVLARAALGAGKDVLVEKPLALDLDEAAGLVECARAGARILMVGHVLRYHPAVEALHALVAAERLGRLRYMHATRLNLGRIRREENILWSFAPHDISMILALAGAMPVRVRAIGSRHLDDAVADVTSTALEFADGLVAYGFVSWLHPFKEQRLTVVGDAAMAVFDDGRPWPEKLIVVPCRVRFDVDTPVPEASAAEPVPLVPREPLKAEARHFLARVADRAAPLTDGAEGLRVLAVLEAAERSMRRALPCAPRVAVSAAAARAASAKIEVSS